MNPLVLKLGGELLETAAGRARLAGCCASIGSARPLVVVHGGGRAIDVELDRRGIAPKKIDGLRITDAPTLDAVIAVLAGSANTEMVAALVAAGVRGVGLTGVDAGFGRSSRASSHQSAQGAMMDLGLVGDPADVDASLIALLLAHDYVPVIASLGIDRVDRATVLNVNADVMACRVAAALTGADLAIAGATPGVLDSNGRSIPALDFDGVDAMIAAGSATAGMVAKLMACRTALADGVRSVRIIDGRSLASAADLDRAAGTAIVMGAKALGARG